MDLELWQCSRFLIGIQHVLAGLCRSPLGGIDLDIVPDAELLGHLTFVSLQQAQSRKTCVIHLLRLVVLDRLLSLLGLCLGKCNLLAIVFITTPALEVAQVLVEVLNHFAVRAATLVQSSEQVLLPDLLFGFGLAMRNWRKLRFFRLGTVLLLLLSPYGGL